MKKSLCVVLVKVRTTSTNRKKMEISGQKESIYDTQYKIDFASHFFFFFTSINSTHPRTQQSKATKEKAKQSAGSNPH